MLAAVTTLIYMVLAPSEQQWRFVLLSDRAGYVVGTHVVVDGGRSTCVSAGTIGVSTTTASHGVSA